MMTMMTMLTTMTLMTMKMDEHPSPLIKENEMDENGLLWVKMDKKG